MNGIVRAATHIAHAQIVVGLGAAALALVSGIEFDLDADTLTLLSVFVGISTWVFYVLHRRVGVQLHSELESIPRFQYILEHWSTLKYFVALGVIVLLVLALQIVRWVPFLPLCIPIAISGLYLLPILGGRRLRDFSHIKLVFIGLMWSLVTVLWPASAADMPTPWLLFVERCLFILAITIPFDIRDMELDRHYGLSTLATRMGMASAKWISLAFLLLAATLVLVLWHWAFVSIFYAVASWLTYIVAAGLILGVDPAKKEHYFSGWIDLTMTILCLAYLIGLWLLRQ